MKSGMAGSQNNGNDGNDVNTKGDTSAKAQESSDSDTPKKQNLSRKNDNVDDEYRMEENGGGGVPQGNIGTMDNKDNMTNKQQTTGPNIHTDDGQIVSNDIQKDLKNSGLVRTVKGPDGSTAQVYLTKNGAHAGLVFRDHISRGNGILYCIKYLNDSRCQWSGLKKQLIHFERLCTSLKRPLFILSMKPASFHLPPFSLPPFLPSFLPACLRQSLHSLSFRSLENNYPITQFLVLFSFTRNDKER
jgi:hypothetical protein